MGHFELRTATDEDWTGIAAGFARATKGDPQRAQQRVAHALHGNPHGASSVLAAHPDGRVIAHLGVTHIPMLVRGEPLLFGRFHSCFIEPAYRTGSVHSLLAALDDRFRETFEDGTQLAAVLGHWDETDWWHLRRARGHDAVATSIDLHRPAGQPLPEPRASAILITQDGDGPLPAGLLETAACGVRHEAGFDTWRAATPQHPGRLWTAWRADERRGLAITRDVDGVRWILDWATAPEDEDAFRALLQAIIADSNTALHTRFWTSDGCTLMLFQEAGFEVVAGPEAYLSVRPVLPHLHHQWLSEHWHVTLADAGLRPMPRLTIGEPIVNPPSPGTLGRQRRGEE